MNPFFLGSKHNSYLSDMSLIMHFIPHTVEPPFHVEKQTAIPRTPTQLHEIRGSRGVLVHVISRRFLCCWAARKRTRTLCLTASHMYKSPRKRIVQGDVHPGLSEYGPICSRPSAPPPVRSCEHSKLIFLPVQVNL